MALFFSRVSVFMVWVSLGMLPISECVTLTESARLLLPDGNPVECAGVVLLEENTLSLPSEGT